MEPSSVGQQLILAKVYKWFNGAYVCVLLAVRKETVLIVVTKFCLLIIAKLHV